MTTPTYKEQFDKLTRAYINGEVDPWDCKACFVGNMLNKKGDWSDARNGDIGILRSGRSKPTKGQFSTEKEYLNAISFIEQHNYTPQEICDIEAMFLTTIINSGGDYLAWQYHKPTPNDEDALFKAFEATLELLKQIHISKGETIDEVPTFTKRIPHPIY